MKALLAAIALIAATPAAPDVWTGLVGANRDAVVKAVGAPQLEFTAVLREGHRPLQVTPSGDNIVADDSEKLPPRVAARVLQYPGGPRGMDWQVVLEGDKVAWAVTPPASDEATASAVQKKYGKSKATAEDVFHADVLMQWDVIAYPAKGVAFVHRPDDTQIVARVLLPASK